MRSRPLVPTLLPFLLSALLSAGCGEPTAFGPTAAGSQASALTAADCTGATDRKVTFCHATSSATNPYVVITVSTNACINAHVGHPGDVLPDVNGACCPVEEQDCAGVCGGTAELDCAGTCEGTAELDCAGTCEGTAELDCAGTCDGSAELDCAGTCDGLAELDCAGTCDGAAELDCAGTCGGEAELDCAGTCDGEAELDCAGTCGGEAQEDCAGTCMGGAELDCAGTCDGTAEVDCAGTCGGLAEDVDVVHFTTNAGVYRWTSGSPATIVHLSTFPSYSLVVSSLGEVFVGTGGIEATAQGLSAPGIYALDGAGVATLLSATAAEDLQIAPGGGLYAANRFGIFAIDEVTGAATQVSTNPTSQFAFENATSVVTTNGTVYASTFTRRTDRINLTTGTTTLLNGDGGEDINVDGGDIRLCGQGGIFRVLPSGAFSNVYNARKVFNFGVGALGDLYLGNSATYGALAWPQGFYAPAISSTALHIADINALVVTEACE